MLHVVGGLDRGRQAEEQQRAREDRVPDGTRSFGAFRCVSIPTRTPCDGAQVMMTPWANAAGAWSTTMIDSRVRTAASRFFTDSLLPLILDELMVKER